jgi:AAA+ superfamily predicted ATPase
VAETESGVGLAAAIRGQLTTWGEAWESSWPERRPVALFRGRYGAGRTAAARFLASGLGRPLLILSAADLVGGEGSPTDVLALAEREALLTDALLCWCDVDALLHPAPGEESGHRAFLRALARGRAPTVLLAEKGWEPGRQLADRPFLHLELPEPGPAERRDAWTAALNGLAAATGEHEASTLAGRFRLTPGQIHDALARARTLAWARDPTNGHPAAEDVEAACRAQAQHRLGTLARKLAPRYGWEDIVLPRPQLATLRLIGATVRHRPVVYGDWGFDRKLARGKGLIALFAGPSGTGKTMAAEIIARDLGLDLYRIDLASVVSKYIGETEKNLERIFAEAQDSDAILFFDEADALFGRRSEVKDAHDRYANIEVAYLLQRTEEYDGLVILASNLKKSMDEAFVRRLHFTIDFPMPEEPERLEIWRRSFPLETPLAGDLDLPFLARKLKIAGGNIRNIVLTSAFLAAEDGEQVAMRHLVRATGLELQKMGKLLVEDDFEQHFALVRT